VSTIPARLTLPRDDRPILIAALFIVAILIAGTTYTWERFGSAPLISPTYLLQHLHIGAFLGIVPAGMMLVILISQIDLSTPWTLSRRDDGDHDRRPGGDPGRPRRRHRQRPRRRLSARAVNALMRGLMVAPYRWLYAVMS
jgi:hypothetical protein